MLHKLARVAPGTAYVAASGDLPMLNASGAAITTVAPQAFAECMVMLSVSAACVMYRRQNSVNNEAREGEPLEPNKDYYIAIIIDPADPVSFRFSQNVTINNFYVAEQR